MTKSSVHHERAMKKRNPASPARGEAHHSRSNTHDPNRIPTQS